MSEQETSSHLNCNAHSGMESRQSVVLWLLGILIAINLGSVSWQFITLGELKDRMADAAKESATQYTRFDAEEKALRLLVQSLETRIQGLENQVNRRPR